MKKFLLLFILIIVSAPSFAANVYFDYPRNNDVFYSSAYFGQAGVEYRILTVSSWYYVKSASDYQTQITYPDGSKSDWVPPQTGVWLCRKAGSYKAQARVWVTADLSFRTNYWLYSNYINFTVIDNEPPKTPTGLSVARSSNNHPVLSWHNNSEFDFKQYNIYKYTYPELGWFLLGTTINTYYEDFSESFVLHGHEANEHWVHYKITAEDINSNTSPYSSEVDALVRGMGLEKKNITSEPLGYSLDQNYPNPFNPNTTIYYNIKENGLVQIKVFDMQGQEIAELVNSIQGSGSYKVNFDASNLPSGLYIYTITTNDFKQSKKMLLLK